MKKIILTVALCMFTMNVSAGQQEDIKLCKNKILDEFGENVTSPFNIGERCKNDTWVFDSWEQFFCQIDRKNNRIYVGKLPYDMEKRKYTGDLGCLAVASLPMQSIGTDVILNPKLEKSIQEAKIIKEKQQQKLSEKKYNELIAKASDLCTNYMKDNPNFVARMGEIEEEIYQSTWTVGAIEKMWGLSVEGVICTAKKVWKKAFSFEYDSVDVYLKLRYSNEEPIKIGTIKYTGK